MTRVLTLLLAAGLTVAAAPPESYVPKLEDTLKDNILNFWLTKSIDRVNGGYKIRFGPNGEDQGDGPKTLVTQARTVWLFSRAARAGYGDRKALLEAADHGYKFLRTAMWNEPHGGFAWETDATGKKKTRPKIHMYGQSFALYAISEYAMASGRKDVLAFANRYFELLDAKAHDAKHGGYNEFFNEDWTPGTGPTYMAASESVKLMNTHLHLMEAMTTYYRASKSQKGRDRLIELISIESNAVVRKSITACTDQYTRDWKPVLEGAGGRVSYGHDLENIWLIADALDAAGLPVSPYLDLFRENFAYSMRFGWDEIHGGFFYYGWFRQPASNRVKSWWVQSEALVSALMMYKLTGDAQYWGVFEKTWAFVERHNIDRKAGEWWESVNDELKASGNKAHGWKAGYHNGRAMIESISLIRSLGVPK